MSDNTLKAIVAFIIGAALVISEFSPPKKCDCSEGKIFVFSTETEVHLINKMDELKAEGDTITLNVLKKIITTYEH